MWVITSIGLLALICITTALVAFFHKIIDTDISLQPYSNIVVWSYLKYYVFWWCIIAPIATLLVGINFEVLF